ncbi:hypothetical protein M426DRAFT_149183 [Hypoxylon sp. CI-4A]|nr:hypothetical protein M426DRAFT_149183 [Hypoxylon sp. CI-4A]
MNCCSRLGTLCVQDLNSARKPRMIVLVRIFIARELALTIFLYMRPTYQENSWSESATRKTQSNFLRCRQGILGPIFHPMRRCPIIIYLLDCMSIQPDPASYLHGQTASTHHTSAPHSAHTAFYVIPRSIHKSCSITVPSRWYLRSLIGPLTPWAHVGLGYVMSCLMDEVAS